MIKKRKNDFRIKTSLILLMILLTSIFMTFPMENFKPASSSKKRNNYSETDNLNPFKLPESSTIKFDPWWNKLFAYRRLINVTNPYDVNLTDTWTSIEFNYADLVNAGKMNNSLKDMRIVESGTEREYYFEKDNPSNNLATVWFRTDCNNGTTELDTYLYYGNNSVEYGSTLVDYNPIGVNWYQFEEGTGNTASNELGRYDGTLVNMEESDWKATTGSDPNELGNYYLNFDGGGGGSYNEYIYIQDQYFTGAESIPYLTVSCWFKTSYSGGQWNNWAFFDFDRSEFFNFFISGDDGTIGFATSSPSRDMRDFKSSTSGLNDGAWHFAMASFNTTHKIIYIDGVVVYDNIELSPHSGQALGRDDSGDEYRYGFIGEGSEADNENGQRNNYYYDGDLDEVRYFNGSLDRQEREQVYNQYELTAALNEEHANTANFKVTAIGLDGEYIPNAIVTLNETSDGSSYIERQITGDDGSTTFTGLATTPVYYNFTVNITSTVDSNLNVRVNISKPILFKDFYDEIEILCNASTVEFDIDDVDGKPVESGWVIVGNQTGITQIQNCSIDETGKARFWWLDDQVYNYNYNYTIWYHQPDYYSGDFDLNKITLSTGNLNPDLQTLTTINIATNLTTVNFDVRQLLPPTDPIEGAVLELYENITTTSLRLVMALTTDDQGNATLRWVNSSSQLGIPGARNYTLRIWFWGYLNQWKIPTIKDVLGTELNFEVANAVNYTVLLSADPDDFQMELLSLNPTDNLFIEWGTKVSMRYLLNITWFNRDPTSGTTPTDADSMTYLAKFGTISISGSLNVEVVGSGRHIAEIDTSQLSIIGSQTTYTVTITAREAGFQSVQNTDLSITVIKNDAYINETNNDESVKSNYWLEEIDLTVQPYGENSETLLLEYEIFKQESNNYKRFDLDFYIPDITTEWSLSRVIFNIYNVTHGNFDNIELNITDPDNNKWTWNNNSINNYYFHSDSVDNGTWINLNVDLNKASKTFDNSFNFTIDGTFSGPVDIIATAYFLRNEIDTQYSLFNTSNNIILPSDGNGWVINNVTFELYNCRNSSDWSPIDPDTVIEKLQTNEGINFTFNSHDLGTGIITISNVTVYPLNDQFLFEIIKGGNIMFDVNITINYIQGFYWNPHLNNVSTTFAFGDYVSGDFIISNNNDDLNNLDTFLQVSDINNVTDTFSSIDVAMNITIGSQTFTLGELSALTLSGFGTNVLKSAYIETNIPVNFTLIFLSTNFRVVNYKITGVIDFEATSIYKGSVSYNDDLETYLLTLDTSLLNAQTYTVVLTFSSDYYETTSKNLNIEVLARDTTLNGGIGLITTIVNSIYVNDAYNFTFIYRDMETQEILTDLDVQYYEWNKYIGNNLVDSGTGTLITGLNSEYILAFNTETLVVGTYTFNIELAKNNYKTKTSSVTLNVLKREIDYELGDEFDDKQISVIKGKTIIIKIELTDPTQGDSPITGANVVLEIGDKELEFDEVEDGVYELKFDTDDYEAFYTSNTLTGTIKISKTNYESEEVDITIVIQMEEVIEGVPTFYLVMIIGAIAAVVGSLATYKFIQIARIPKFVKKARAMKKAIKRKGAIPESLTTSTKENYILNQFRDEWDALGLSLGDILGVKAKKDKQYDMGGGIK